MRITCFSTFLLLQSSQAFVSQQQPVHTTSRATVLQERKQSDNGWFGPVATAFAGLTLASQAAFGAPLPMAEQPAEAQAQFADAPSTVISGSIETMDFSMPSYGDATKGDVNTGKRDVPSFNPFESMREEKTEDSSSAADEKAAAETKKAEEKAAAEAKKAEEKAAADTKKAEEQAAAEAKKAEKEARRQAEIQKQKEMAERAAREREEKAVAPSSAPAPKPAAPEISVPSFSAPQVPEFKAPEFKAPEFKAPDFKAPDFKAPEMPKFSLPSSSGDFKAPEFSAPKMPSFEAPKSGGGGYDFGFPSSSSSSNDDNLEPQEVRDQRAREARGVFVDADNEAKEAERQARELRNIANEKKKTAKEAKDEACKTRPGGKILCIRGFGSGY